VLDQLVGADEEAIVGAVQLLENPKMYEKMSRVHNPNGDGCASTRIADAIYSFYRENYASKPAALLARSQ
jgi:UDP-N-acetylglucosamine 2-epimerase (non-hydrolysing)